MEFMPPRVAFRIVAFAQALNIFLTLPAWADTLFKPEGACSRSFIYRNRTYAVDSSRKLDGEGLRPVIKKNAQSEDLLNNYQTSLKSQRWTAYTGSLGLVMAAGGSIYANTLKNPIAQRDTRNMLLFPGLFLAVGSYVYGQLAIRNNEKTLEKAVDTYNDSAPTTEKIRVGLAPLSNDTGGEIKTQVPF